MNVQIDKLRDDVKCEVLVGFHYGGHDLEEFALLDPSGVGDLHLFETLQLIHRLPLLNDPNINKEPTQPFRIHTPYPLFLIMPINQPQQLKNIILFLTNRIDSFQFNILLVVIPT